MRKNVPTLFWLLFFQFLHGFKGEFLNYILKCNRLKSTKCSTRKKNDTLNKIRKILYISGYKRHLEAIALLSFPPENATLNSRRGVTACSQACSREARGLPVTRATPPRRLHPVPAPMDLSGARTSNAAITQRQNLRNLYSPIFGKYSEPQEGLSITMNIIGNGTDFAQTQSPPLFK